MRGRAKRGGTIRRRVDFHADINLCTRQSWLIPERIIHEQSRRLSIVQGDRWDLDGRHGRRGHHLDLEPARTGAAERVRGHGCRRELDRGGLVGRDHFGGDCARRRKRKRTEGRGSGEGGYLISGMRSERCCQCQVSRSTRGDRYNHGLQSLAAMVSMERGFAWMSSRDTTGVDSGSAKWDVAGYTGSDSAWVSCIYAMLCYANAGCWMLNADSKNAVSNERTPCVSVSSLMPLRSSLVLLLLLFDMYVCISARNRLTRATSISNEVRTMHRPSTHRQNRRTKTRPIQYSERTLYF